MSMKRFNGGCERISIETADGALIHVETRGTGKQTVFLLHGWTMSSAFWVRQKEALAETLTVVAIDLRAHGHSSKTPSGHTIPQYAQDVRLVMECLDLTDATLVGWSLAGPVVLEYWHTYGDDRVSALGLVEMTPYPMSPEPWNTHALRGHNMEGLANAMAALKKDPETFGRRFIGSMFHDGIGTPEDQKWMLREYLKTPTDQAVAIYSDYVMRDYTGVLGEITVPVLVANGRFGHLCFGPKTGQYVGESIPKGHLELYDGSGHMPFYEAPDVFNRDMFTLAGS